MADALVAGGDSMGTRGSSVATAPPLPLSYIAGLFVETDTLEVDRERRITEPN